MKDWGKKIGTIFLVICLLTGCADVPEVKSGSGTSKADGKNNKMIETIKNSKKKDLSQYDFLTKSDNGYICKVSLGEGNVKLNLETEIENTGGAEIPVFEAEANIVDWNPEQFEKIFFKNQNDIKDVTAETQEEYVSEKEGEDQIQVMPSSHFLKLRGNGDSELEIKDNYLYYYNDELLKKGKQTEEKRENETDISKDFTMDMAWNQLEEIFRKSGLGEIKRESTSAVYYENGHAEYIMSFSNMVNDMPIITTSGSATIDVLSAAGYAIVTPDGVSEIQNENGFWKIQKEINKSVLDIGQFIELLEQYVKDGKIQCSDQVFFEKCELGYYLSTEDWKTATLTPAWRIYIPAEEVIGDEKLSGLSVPYDIVIDAVSGEILRMQ